MKEAIIIMIAWAVTSAKIINDTHVHDIRNCTHLFEVHESWSNPLRHKTEEQLRAMLGGPEVQEDENSLTRALQPISVGIP